MRTAIVIDDSTSTSYNPRDNSGDGYILRAEIAIGEAYLRQDPDASIIGLNAGLVKDFSDLTPGGPTPQKEFIQAIQDYDRVVLIMDNPLSFNDTLAYIRGHPFPSFDHELKVVSSALDDTELQIVIVENDMLMAADNLHHHQTSPMIRLLTPHITMIVDPQAILDFGF